MASSKTKRLGSFDLTPPQQRFLLAFLLDRRKILAESIARLETYRDYSRKLSSEQVCNANIRRHRDNLQWINHMLVSLGAEPEELAEYGSLYSLNA